MALPVLAQLQLASPDASVRLAAAEELSKSGVGEAIALLHRALAREKDAACARRWRWRSPASTWPSTDAPRASRRWTSSARAGNDGFLPSCSG